MFTSKPPTCAGRTLALPRKDRDIRYLRPLGNSDIAQNFYGPVGNVAHNSHSFSQTATGGVSDADLRRLITELGGRLDELQLGVDEKRAAQTQLDTLNEQLNDTPDPAIIQEAGRTLRRLTEGAISSLIAKAAEPQVWSWVNQLLATF